MHASNAASNVAEDCEDHYQSPNHVRAILCRLTSALCRTVGGAKRRRASVGHQRAVRLHRHRRPPMAM
jgi:hypothetical protein